MHIDHLEFSIMSNAGICVADYAIKWESAIALPIPPDKGTTQATILSLLRQSLSLQKEWESTLPRSNKTQAFAQATAILKNGDVTRFSMGKGGGILACEHNGDELTFAFNLEHED